MASTPLLQVYRQHLADADFHNAKLQLDAIERAHGRDAGFDDLIAAERERLEQLGVLLCPFHYHHDTLATIRNGEAQIERQRLGAQHDWYLNAELEDCLVRHWRLDSADGSSASVQTLLVLGNNFSLSTGVFRPISHYLNFLHHLGGIRLCSVQLAVDASPQTIERLLEQHDVVVINGLQQICNVIHLADVVAQRARARPVYGYLHETQWILNRLPDDQKQRIRDILPSLDLLLCCERQIDDFAPYGSPRSQTIIHNPTLRCPTLASSRKPIRRSGQILMSGTVKERKGIAFYNNCAEQFSGEGYVFHWAGQQRDPSSPHSQDVVHHGHLQREQLQTLMRQSDIFLLSSLEDTFPLAAVEAYLNGCKLLLPRSTGLIDVMEGRPGVLVYDNHDVACLAPLLRELRKEPAPSAQQRNAIASRLGLDAFLSRLHGPLMQSCSTSRSIEPPLEQQPQRQLEQQPEQTWQPTVAVIAHLYYTDLGYELLRQLEAVAGPQTDLYVTIPVEKSSAQLLQTLRSILEDRFRKVRLMTVPNRGMDIGPFFEVIRELVKTEVPMVDLLLKVHMKKSLKVSGARKGRRWRHGLLDGLLGDRCNVQAIIDTFAANPDLGLLAPHKFLMTRSRRDQSVGSNEALVSALLDRHGLDPDPARPFVRGTMFWARSTMLIPALTAAPLPTSEDFELGHASDGSLAHAYERLLSYLPQRHHPVHPYQGVAASC